MASGAASGSDAIVPAHIGVPMGEDPTVGKRILVIDDDDTIRELIVMALSDEGYDTAVACHGAEALAQLSRASADLILLDMRMPVMDGWEFARAYLETPGPHAPVLVLTAGRSAAEAATAIGAAGHLAKPFELADLLGAVTRALNGHHPPA